MQTVVGLTHSSTEAEQAVRLVQEGGFDPAGVGAADNLLSVWRTVVCKPISVLVSHVAVGSVLGIALFAYLGVLLAAGRAALGYESPLAAEVAWGLMALGGVAGALLGPLVGMGDSAGEVGRCMCSLRRGGALVIVHTANEHAPRAAAILRRAGADEIRICLQPACTPPPAGVSTWTRWAARLLGVGLLVAVALILAGQGRFERGLPVLHALSMTDHALLIALLLALAGVLVAWRWEGAGGLLIVASILLFQSVNALSGGSWHASVLDPLFYLTGLLFLWDWRRTASSGSLSLRNP